MRLCVLSIIGVMVALNCGCSGDLSGAKQAATTAAAEQDAVIEKALATLSPEDRAAAVAQRWCVVEQENRLGSMEAPVKLMLDGKPVFVCCDGCKANAVKDEAATLKTAAELREINEAFGKLSPEDRVLAEKQRFCAFETDHRLGTMGPPFKLLIEGKPVFLCCSGCEQAAMAKAAETLAAAEKLSQGR